MSRLCTVKTAAGVVWGIRCWCSAPCCCSGSPRQYCVAQAHAARAGKPQGRTAPGVQREHTAGRQLAERLCPLDAGSVLLRDAAVNTQRAADEVLFRKAEEGGILLGKDRWMFTKLFTVDDATRKQLAKNVQAVSEFAANHPGKVTFLLAPSASVIYRKNCPQAHRWWMKTRCSMIFLPKSARAPMSSTCAGRSQT